jgi:hypothetical protein
MGREFSSNIVWVPSVNSNHGSRSRDEINWIVSGSQPAAFPASSWIIDYGLIKLSKRIFLRTKQIEPRTL